MKIFAEPKTVYLNPKQTKFIKAKERTKVFIGGRGSGKTAVLSVHHFLVFKELPRAKFFLAGLTYNQILTKFLPPMIEMWERLGLKYGIHYVIGTKPPSNWQTPYQPPRRWENVISIYTGNCIELISLDRKDSSRGGNYDGGSFDEAVLIDKDQHDKELLPSIRGNIYRFPNNPLHHSKIYVSSQSWFPRGNWVPDMKGQKGVFYIESTAYDNIHVLGKEYIDDLKKSQPFLTFQVEVMNMRLSKPPNAFYDEFDEKKHCYYDSYSYDFGERGIETKGNKDYNPKEALEVSFDFNAGFNSLLVCQEERNTLKFIKEFYVTGSKIIDHLVDEFTNYYSKHEEKLVYIWGDRNGNNKIANSELTFYEQIMKRLKAADWTCVLKSEGLDPLHRMKHFVINQILSESDNNLPKIRINQNECKSLILSIQGAPCTPDFKKDKRSEKQDIPQEQATHLSDAFDNIVHPKYHNKVKQNSEPSEVVFW